MNENLKSVFINDFDLRTWWSNERKMTENPFEWNEDLDPIFFPLKGKKQQEKELVWIENVIMREDWEFQRETFFWIIYEWLATEVKTFWWD